MRQKQTIRSWKTDLDIFRELEIGDPWTDASMPSLYIYLYHKRKLRIPDSWEPTMTEFYWEMQKLVLQL